MKKLKRAYRKNAKLRKSFRYKAIRTGAAAAITFGAGAGLHKAFAGDVQAVVPDLHQIAVNNDSDNDLLSDSEEIAIGYEPFNRDQNKNAISDGIELAQRVAKIIEDLPLYIHGTMMPIPNKTYKIAHLMYGLEACDICGEQYNMGGYEIVNPRINLTFPDPLDSAFLPELAVHYMSHGSFDCLGEVHNGRVDIPRLMRVLELQFLYETDIHQSPLDGNDIDDDFLTDSEELSAGFNLHDPDQNNNLIPDGIEFAQQCAAAIEALPQLDASEPQTIYKESFMLRGLEYCDICGESVNMGHWLVTNATLGLSIEVPVITLHYMTHGSFSYSGDVHGTSRIDADLLKKILEMPRECGDLGTIFLPGDTNKDCRVDINDLNEFIAIWLEEMHNNSD
jgi:hypothetical protein